MKIEVPVYEDLKEINHWVPPHPSCLMLMLVNRKEEEIKIDFVPDMEDENDYPTNLMYPRDIFFNGLKVKLKSEEERRILDLLNRLITENKLGHPEGLGVLTAKEMIMYFSEIKVPAFNDIKEFDFWVPPQPSSLMLKLVNRQDEEIKIDFLPDMDDDNDYPSDLMRPRDIFLNGHKVVPKSEEGKKILDLLKHSIKGERFPGMLKIAEEMIAYFSEVEIPAYEELKEIKHWVPPQPGSLVLTLVNRKGEKIWIDFLPEGQEAMKDFPNELMRKRFIAVNGHKLELNPEEKRKIQDLLNKLIAENKLGHPGGLGVLMAMEMIAYCNFI